MEDGTMMGGASPHATPQGQRKRLPEDELDGEQRLSKRFNLLNLEQTGKLYIPVKSEAESSARPSPPRRRRSNAVTDSMPVEDNKDRVYIHNLDEEIADIESDDEKIIFLPDIERHLTKIPRAILTGDSHSNRGSEMVLYSMPSSLTLSQEQDAVRRAIEETRARAHGQAKETPATTSNDRMNGRRMNHDENDADAMDTE